MGVLLQLGKLMSALTSLQRRRPDQFPEGTSAIPCLLTLVAELLLRETLEPAKPLVPPTPPDMVWVAVPNMGPVLMKQKHAEVLVACLQMAAAAPAARMQPRPPAPSVPAPAPVPEQPRTAPPAPTPQPSAAKPTAIPAAAATVKTTDPPASPGDVHADAAEDSDEEVSTAWGVPWRCPPWVRCRTRRRPYGRAVDRRPASAATRTRRPGTGSNGSPPPATGSGSMTPPRPAGCERSAAPSQPTRPGATPRSSGSWRSCAEPSARPCSLRPGLRAPRPPLRPPLSASCAADRA